MYSGLCPSALIYLFIRPTVFPKVPGPETHLDNEKRFLLGGQIIEVLQYEENCWARLNNWLELLKVSTSCKNTSHELSQFDSLLSMVESVI